MMYYNWLVEQIYSPLLDRYSKLLRFLYTSPFIYTHPMDENRYLDGMELRSQIDLNEDEELGECSMLEMMVALALRIDSIMNASNDASTAYYWFEVMLQSSGLIMLDDNEFGYEKARTIIAQIENRTYEPDGHGGLFAVYGTDRDMRELEIWYQAQEYLCEMT